MSLMNVPEDLSGMSRTDLVYKAKLAEQAERCVRHSHFGVCSLNKDAGRGWLFSALAYPDRPSRAQTRPGSSRTGDAASGRPGARIPHLRPPRALARVASAPVAPIPTCVSFSDLRDARRGRRGR